MTASVPTHSAERMIEAGTTAAVVAFVLAAGRMIATSIVGPYPELFVGVIGGIWWGIFGASAALAFATYAVTIVIYAAESVRRITRKSA